MKSDSELQADVLEELRSDQRLVPSELGVSAADGIVSLFGEVDSLAKRTAAVNAAGRVHGVRAVANGIHVRLPLDHLRTDADIAHDAVHALMWDTEVPDKTIRVRVQDRWVWLLGEAESQHQRTAAERAVEPIRGVKGITNLVRIRTRSQTADLGEQVQASLKRNAQLARREIAVTQHDGAVVLEGRVESWSERMAAEHCAWMQCGVTDVDNKLAVTPR
jgi:osmotically-inducible protein OsmY